MAAYASYQRECSAGEHHHRSPNRRQLATAPSVAAQRTAAPDDSAGINQLIDVFAERVAAAIAAQLTAQHTTEDEWFDCRHAADYLGIHRDTLRKLAAARVIASEQDGPGCKLYFRRSDLDAWRRSGGRPRHLQAMLASVA